MVSPNKLHHLFIGDWARRLAGGQLYASPGLARRRRDLSLRRPARATIPIPPGRAIIDQVVFHGSFAMEEVVFFHRSSRTAIFTDLSSVSTRQPARLAAAGDATRRAGRPHGSTPREWRLSFWIAAAARRARSAALAWNPQRVIIAHGEWVRDTGAPCWNARWRGWADRCGFECLYRAGAAINRSPQRRRGAKKKGVGDPAPS